MSNPNDSLDLDFLLDEPPPIGPCHDDDSTCTGSTFVTARTSHSYQTAWGPVHSFQDRKLKHPFSSSTLCNRSSLFKIKVRL